MLSARLLPTKKQFRLDAFYFFNHLTFIYCVKGG